MVKAVESLLAKGLDLELVVVGASDPADRGASATLAKQVTALREQGRVQFVGNRAFGPELFQAYADADVLVLPSLTEGTPRVLVEARAFRCPVVATNVGGIPTSVRDGEDGLLVPPADAAALAQAIERVARDRAFAERLIERGLAKVRNMTIEGLSADILAGARQLGK